MPSQVTVDFYRVRIGDAVASRFERVLARVHASGAEARNHRVAEDVHRLHGAVPHQNSVEGEVTRIRLGDHPSIASLTGHVAELALNADQGLGEHAAFLYHVPTQVLLLQRNRHSMTARNFASYFDATGGAADPIFLDPVLREDAVRRLAEFQEVRTFNVRFARVDNPALFGGDEQGVGEMIDVINYFHAPSAQFSLSMGRRRGSLPVNVVKAVARRLMAIPRGGRSNEVKKLFIKGTNTEGDVDELDLTSYKMFEVVGVVAPGRRTRYPVRREAIRTALASRLEELNRMFLPEGAANEPNR